MEQQQGTTMKKLSLGEWGFLIIVTVIIIIMIIAGVNMEKPTKESNKKTCELNGGFSFINNSSYNHETLIFCNDGSVRWNNKEQP